MIKRIAFAVAFGLLLDGCCNDDFILPDYDFFEYAIDLTSIVNADCESNPIYTTEGATADGSDENSCDITPLHNRWFKFLADFSFMTVSIRIADGFGTQSQSLAVLWDSEGNEIDCDSYDGSGDDLFVYGSSLSSGKWYYISVDVDDSESVGTFTICLLED